MSGIASSGKTKREKFWIAGMKKKKKDLQIPQVEQLEKELAREKYKSKYNKALRSTIYTLITVAAIAILAATLWLPVLEIYGNSMSPTLGAGDIVLTVKSKDLEPGDIIAFYYNNKILVKRVIASAGDWIDMDNEGNVYVNNELLEEPYLVEKAYGNCDLEFPYQVPESRVFVMGDHRSTSVDSRNTAIGCIPEEEIVGKLIVRVWPLSKMNYL